MTLDTRIFFCGSPPKTGQRQQYPGRFFAHLKRYYPEFVPAMEGASEPRILHMFSGTMDWGDTTDFRAETGAKIVAPYDAIPLPDSSFDIVLADPPYAKGFSNEWVTQPKDVPRPKRILSEAVRLVKPGGKVFILHVIVIAAYKSLKVRRIGLHPVFVGPNNAIRVLNVFSVEKSEVGT